jgi:hypothetical protein
MSSNESAVRFNQPLRPLRRRARRRAAGEPAWPSFKGNAKLIGKSEKEVSVYVDEALGREGEANAEALLAQADAVVDQNNTIFGIAGEAVDVIVFALGGQTDGTGGADHDGCDFTVGNAIEVDASFGQPTRVIALFEAELSECAMNGRLCGLSTGEALSRWCSMAVSANALSDFATAPQWAEDGMPNWVDRTAPTDRDPGSTGCGMVFLSWLLSKDHKLSDVAKAMVNLKDEGTLAAVYGAVTGDAPANAWGDFKRAVGALPNGVTSDDPFNALPTLVL